MNDIRCVGRTYGDGRGGTYCSRRGSVRSHTDGQLYCKQHLPENRAAKQAAWREKFDADCDLQKRQRKADKLVNQAAIDLRVAVKSKDILLVGIAAVAWDTAISKREELND